MASAIFPKEGHRTFPSSEIRNKPSEFPADRRRFGIALSTDLPALTYFNPLLNNPSSSEYVASVRSSLRSSSVSSQSNSPQSGAPRKNSIFVSDTSAAIFASEWNQLPGRSEIIIDERVNKENLPSVNLPASKWINNHFIDKKSYCRSIILAFLFVMVFLGAIVTLLIYFIANQEGLTSDASLSHVHTIYGEFQIVNFTVLPDMEDENSTSFLELASVLQSKLDRMFQNSSLLSEIYNRSEVIGIATTSGPLQKPFVRIQLKIILNRSDIMVAEKMALIFMNNLQHKEEYRLLEDLTVNLSSVKFTETVPANVMSLISPENGLASWGAWTKWSPECPQPCNQSQMQMRNRRCLLREASLLRIDLLSAYRQLDNIAPCLMGSTVSSADVELRECQKCSNKRNDSSQQSRPLIPFSVIRNPHNNRTASNRFRFDNVSMIALEKTCSECRTGEVCVARLEEVVPICRWAPDPDDYAGCGGFCRANTETCVPFGSNSFRCHENNNSGCLAAEWRCRDGTCITSSKRCDGHYNCLDQSDETQCIPG